MSSYNMRLDLLLLLFAGVVGLAAGAAIISYRIEACRSNSPSRSCMIWVDDGGLRLYPSEVVIRGVVDAVQAPPLPSKENQE